MEGLLWEFRTEVSRAVIFANSVGEQRRSGGFGTCLDTEEPDGGKNNKPQLTTDHKYYVWCNNDNIILLF